VALVQQKKKARVERAHDDTDTDTERARARAAAFSTCEFAVRVQLRRCPVPVPMDGRHGSVVRSVDRSACCARLGSVWRLAGAVSMKVRWAPALSTREAAEEVEFGVQCPRCLGVSVLGVERRSALL